MRGSIYYQTAELTKVIFVEGAKKEERVDPTHPNFQCVSSFKTMETYRGVWNNFGHYLKEHWGIKDFEQIDSEHIQAYMAYKIEYYPTKQYLEKISAALGKLERALINYTAYKYGELREYDFNIRQNTLDNARALKQVANGYHNRVYKDPQALIGLLSNPNHQLGAMIQLHGGARSEGITLIKPHQLHGYKTDEITGKEVAVIKTTEKGGKTGDILIPIIIYKQLEKIIADNGKFKINYKAYVEDIRKSCLINQMECHSSHGFRWTFAQNRVREYQRFGYSYEEALQGVSWEIKHFRSSVTEHYLG